MSSITAVQAVIASHPSAAVWAKMDLVVLPMIAMMYFLASLVSYAS